METFKWSGCLITGYPFVKNHDVTTFKKINLCKKAYKENREANAIKKYLKNKKQNEAI